MLGVRIFVKVGAGFMISTRRDFWVGAGVVFLSLVLIIYFIPQFVVAPKYVRNVVLSPVFWPSVISWMMLFIGGGILVSQYLERGCVSSKTEPDAAKGAYVRILVFGLFLIVYYILMPVLGMVLSSTLAFIVFSIFMAGTKHRKTAVIVGVLLPLALYAFFYHVAGVNIPQGELMRLP
jgi:hypothetical protein